MRGVSVIIDGPICISEMTVAIGYFTMSMLDILTDFVGYIEFLNIYMIAVVGHKYCIFKLMK